MIDALIWSSWYYILSEACVYLKTSALRKHIKYIYNFKSMGIVASQANWLLSNYVSSINIQHKLSWIS
jgi:hypothetical protein